MRPSFDVQYHNSYKGPPLAADVTVICSCALVQDVGRLGRDNKVLAEEKARLQATLDRLHGVAAPPAAWATERTQLRDAIADLTRLRGSLEEDVEMLSAALQETKDVRACSCVCTQIRLYWH